MNTKTIEKQQRVADIILDRLETLDPTAILAGGAPRDWYLGEPANDLDFYYHTRYTSEMDVKEQLRKIGLDLAPLDMSGWAVNNKRESLYSNMPGLIRVFEGVYRGVKIQVMLMSNPTFRGVVEEFACSLSKFWYKRGTIGIDPDAKLTMDSGVGYFKEGYSAENKYVKKMDARFPDYVWLSGRTGWLDVVKKTLR